MSRNPLLLIHKPLAFINKKQLSKTQKNILGVWKGYYKHESKNIPKERRVQKTYFTIEITKFNNNKFEGKISEDKKSSGMNGVGSIIGSQ